MRLNKSNSALVLIILFFLCLMVSCTKISNPNKSSAFKQDNEDSIYKNPIIFADYSDPDVIRVSDDFYMTASSFNCVPGLPILHSRDLVNWELIGYAIECFADERFNSPQHGNGVWAPAIRYHNGWFWIFYGDPDAGIFMTKTKNPEGPWEPLVCVKEAKGLIDTCPFWDDDGNAYLVHAWAKSRSGINSILTIARMSEDGTKLLDEGEMVFDGHVNHPTIEGPKMYKRNSYYYIFAPAGGVHNGWQTVLRSQNVFGPYEDKIVLAQGNTNINGPHQGGLVELQSGESWFIHFQELDTYGRIVHLQPVKWVNDWPVMGIDEDGDGKGEPVLSYRKPNVDCQNLPIAGLQTTDEFNSKKLGLQWQWHANYQNDWFSLTERPGWLRLLSVPKPEGFINLWSVPNLLLQKFPASEFTVTTKIESNNLAVGDKTGIVIMGIDYSYLAVERASSGYRLVNISCKDANKDGREIEKDSADLQSRVIFLRVKVNSDKTCNFSYSNNGKEFISLGESFSAREGRWIGAKVGLFCLAQNNTQKSGYVDYDWFRFE